MVIGSKRGRYNIPDSEFIPNKRQNTPPASISSNIPSIAISLESKMGSNRENSSSSASAPSPTSKVANTTLTSSSSSSPPVVIRRSSANVDKFEKVLNSSGAVNPSPDRPTSVPESDDSSFEVNSDIDSGDANSLISGRRKNTNANSNDLDISAINSLDEDEDDFGDAYEEDESLNDADEFEYEDDEDDMGFDDFDEGDAEAEDEDEFYEDLTQLKTPKFYETQFRVITPSQLRHSQQKKIEHVASFLSVTQAQAKALLWAYNWRADSLIESYIDNRAKLLQKAGLFVDSNGNPVSTAPYNAIPAPPGFTCFICCEGSDSVSDKDFLIFQLECSHAVCVDCFRTYIRQKVNEEGESRQIGCPQYKCGVYVPEDAVKYLFIEGEDKTNLPTNGDLSNNDINPSSTDKTLYEKYEGLLDKEYVARMDKTTFCPAPDCQLIIECLKVPENENLKVPSVKCTCGKAFCFACGLDDHMPATCKIAKAWLKKCRDDSETANWIAANTQECTKCHSTIEKNGGCNHMTCKKCKQEFCWICMGEWCLHGTSYYNCSRYNEQDAQTARSEQDKSRSQLKRYLHYYNRYMNHLHSLKLDSETFEQMQKKMKQMQESAGMSWIEVQFLSQAFEVLSASRHTLTWTYAFAFYLQKTHRTLIFEDNQNDLEVAVEQLSELFEKPANDLASLKVQLLDKCQYVSSRRVVLLEDAAQGLLEGKWEYMPI